ncbi:MAG: insulinase family protein [Alphaproteobacteria bacterium]|nr:insulinase family protein [Alphaproteobacteria bacterium]
MSLTVNVGHVNEPKLGIAALFEKVLLMQSTGIQAVYGGTITSYFTGFLNRETEMTMQKMSNLVVAPHFNAELIKTAAEDIIKHTLDRAPLPKRQMKLLYKHRAFGDANKVWDTELYIKSIRSYGVTDLQEFADKYMTAKNMVLVVSGKFVVPSEVEQLAEKYFGQVAPGKRLRVDNELYTGGFASLPAFSSYRQVMMGWDVSRLEGVAEANVLMSMLINRLERSFVGTDADVEVKIAGYYGLRTLRISVKSDIGGDINSYIDIVCANIRRIRTTLASERRMETSRNQAMCEKLFTFSQQQAGSVETAWQLLGRGQMYDINERINSTWQVTAHLVREVARDIFAQPLTYVVYANKPFYSYEEVMAKL